MGGSGVSTVILAGGHIDAINSINNIEPIRFCNWAAPEWGDPGATSESTWYQAALVAVATINTIAQFDIANKRYGIAKDYANIATDKWNWFVNGHSQLEISMLNEVSTTGRYQPQYAEARSDYQSFARNAYTQADATMGRLARKYKFCMDPTLVRDLALAGDLVRDDSVNFGYRYEEHRAIVRDDVRFGKRSSILNLGRDNLAQSFKAAGLANEIFGGLSDLIGNATGGALGTLGYLNERRDTQYPTQFAGVAGLVGEAGYGGLFDGLYTGAQLGPNSTAENIRSD